MTEKNYIELAIKYGGYMETDKVFLENRLSNLTAKAKAGLLVPPPSVINAYFSELYQKRTPKEATSYFFGMSKAFGMFFDTPKFDAEGSKDYQLFRFIRLNIDGKAFGFSYLSDKEEAIIFSQLPYKADQKFLLNLAQIFPHYVIYEEAGQIRMKPYQFETFSDQRELSSVTSAAENQDFIQFYSFNIEDLLEQSGALTRIGQGTYYKFDAQLNQFVVYQSKGN